MDHQVDNRRLVPALKAAFLKAGGTLREHCPVERVHLEPGGPFALELGGAGTQEARRLVLAAGSWSGLIPGLSEALRPLVRPVKGQMLCIQAAPDLLRHVVRTPDCYIVPRGDGRLIVGATVEEMGFDKQLTVGGCFELLRGAWRAIPGVYELPVAELWAGLRPGSRDNAPLLGETEIPGFFLATGHYRNGILNTPVTALWMSELILGAQPTPFQQRFSPRRFAAAGA
jgi:glycine oxidase